MKESAAASDKIMCHLCGVEVHQIATHLERMHNDLSVEQYAEKFPHAELVSEAVRTLTNMRAKTAATKPALKAVPNDDPVFADLGDRTIRTFNRVFGIPDTVAAARRTDDRGPIPIVVMTQRPKGYEDMLPEIDKGYIFPINETKLVLLGIEKRFNIYLVGHAGTGKSSLIDQVHARTGRAVMRVQHTVNTEETHILGQYTLRDGSTVWEPGPLQICMKYGLTYLADEYDRGTPHVLSVYQAVLEGKALVTKEAPPEWRIVKPHDDFRFCATGNTNGAGDNTGLYNATLQGDYANFERFGMMIEIGWMPRDQEASVIRAQSGCPAPIAVKLVDFAHAVRKEADANRISSPVSPRSLINAAKIGVCLSNFSAGVNHAIAMRMNPVDREAVTRLSQRFLG